MTVSTWMSRMTAADKAEAIRMFPFHNFPFYAWSCQKAGYGFPKSGLTEGQRKLLYSGDFTADDVGAAMSAIDALARAS